VASPSWRSFHSWLRCSAGTTSSDSILTPAGGTLSRSRCRTRSRHSGRSCRTDRCGRGIEPCAHPTVVDVAVGAVFQLTLAVSVGVTGLILAGSFGASSRNGRVRLRDPPDGCGREPGRDGSARPAVAPARRRRRPPRPYTERVFVLPHSGHWVSSPSGGCSTVSQASPVGASKPHFRHRCVVWTDMVVPLSSEHLTLPRRRTAAPNRRPRRWRSPGRRRAGSVRRRVGGSGTGFPSGRIRRCGALRSPRASPGGMRWVPSGRGVG